MREIKWDKVTFDADEYLNDLMKKSDNDEDEVQFPANLVDTPFGPSAILNPFDVVKKFDFYMANTNFELDWQEVGTIQNAIEGIEGYRKISKYRFVVAIAEMFSPFTVKLAIDYALQVDSAIILLMDSFDKFVALDAKECRYFLHINEEREIKEYVDSDRFEAILTEARASVATCGGDIMVNFKDDGTLIKLSESKDIVNTAPDTGSQ
jgi:hypothetical protein